MSSPNLEDGEITSEELNETLQANDKLLLQKTVNTKLDEMHCNSSGGVGPGAGVILATVSISMEQSQELGYKAQNSVENGDGNGNVTATTTTLSMSRTQTRKIITSYSSADYPLDIDTVVTFDDQPIAKFANEKSTRDDGNMKRNKRRIVSKNNNAEIQPPKKRSPNKSCSSLKGNRFSVLTSDSQIDDFIDEDEMVCVRGASPQHTPILTKLCLANNGVNGKLKPLKKAKTKKFTSKRAGNSARSKKSKKKINTDKKETTKQKTATGLNIEDAKGFAILPVELSTLQQNEKVHKDNTTGNNPNCYVKLNNNEALQELRQKLCFLTEQQFESLLQLNVHRPYQALHLTLWQLNSIGINKATQLEALLATVLNGQDVDMRKLLPQTVAPIEQNLSNITHISNTHPHAVEEEEEDDDHPLVIDETDSIYINEEEHEKTNTKEAVLKSSMVPFKLGAHIDENEIRQATRQIAERIQKIKTSNAECTVKKQELLHILDKLNELENQDKILKITKNEEQQDLVKPITSEILPSEILSKASNKHETQINEASNYESLPINAVTDEEKISALNSQDKNKDQSEQEESSELVAEQTKLSLNPFAKSSRKITQNNEMLEKTMLKSEENCENSLGENSSLAADVPNTKAVDDDKPEKTEDKDVGKAVIHKPLTATHENAKMTLRSQRKIISTQIQDTKSPFEQNSLQDYLDQPKVVISNIKPRRLKITKRSLTAEPNTAQEVMEKNHLSNDSEQTVTPEKKPLLVFFDTPKTSTPNTSTLNTSTPISSTTNISLFNISAATTNATQYTDDWEDCIDETRIMAQPKASPSKSQAQLKDVKCNEDLRLKIEEKKRLKEENEAKSRILSSPTKMRTDKPPTNILPVEKDILQQIKIIHDESSSEEPKSIIKEITVESDQTNKNEDKVAEKITANETVDQELIEPTSAAELNCDDEKLEKEDLVDVDAYDMVEKSIAIKCAEEQKNNFEKILEQTNSIINKNVEQISNIEKSYEDQESNVQSIAIERKSPEIIDIKSKSYADNFSDEENWDNPETCSVDPRTKRDTYNTHKVMSKSYNDKYSPEKRSNTNDYNDFDNSNSYDRNNANKKSKNSKFNANQRGKYGDGQKNNADNYNTGRQANNSENYTGRQANNSENYTGRKANNPENYTGRQENNSRKYTVEQRCSESRGPYQVKYDSDEDWDKDEINEGTAEKNSSSKFSNSYSSINETITETNTSNNFSNSYNSNHSHNSNNETNNEKNTSKNFSKSCNSNPSFNSHNNYNSKNFNHNTSSNSSSDKPASVIGSPIKDYNTEKPQAKNFNKQQKSSNKNQMDDWDIVSPTALSPVCPEIASPTYPSVPVLNDYTPAIEIDAHMSFPPMPYCLREIKLPNIEVNKPESLDKLLRSNTVDPRLLKYKDKGYMDIATAPPMLSYFSSQQISQYDPRRRTSVMHTSTAQAFQMDCCSPMQPQNVNVLLYRYLQRSAWYQGLMSTMKMQINHSIAELVRALNNFQKERLIDASAIFDVFKIDCAGELLEIMRNIGIFIDANGYISEDRGFGQYGQQAALNRPAPINATYSFMPQILSTPLKQGLLSYSPSGVGQHTSCPVVLPPQMQAASFVSCYVDAPTLTPMIPRRSCGYNVQNTDSVSPPPLAIDGMHEEQASGSDAGYYGNNNRNFDMGDERRNDRPPMRGGNGGGGGGGGGGGFNGNRRRGGGSFNSRQRY